MAFPEESVWKKHYGATPPEYSEGLVRAGRFTIDADDLVEWEVRKTSNGRYYAVNNYFTKPEAWDNAWIEDFRTTSEAVNFARNMAKIAFAAMQASHERHPDGADPEEVAAVVNVGRYEPPPPQMGGASGIHASMMKAFQTSAKFDFCSDFLSTPEVLEMLAEIKRSGGKAIALLDLGDVCIRKTSWEAGTAPCDGNILTQGYMVLNTIPLKAPWTADLNLEQLVLLMPEYSREQIRRAMKAYKRDDSLKVMIQGNFTLYGDMKPYVPVSMNGSKDEPENAYNLIGHASDWDGTLRTYKALTAIERFHPRSAGQIAQIFLEEKNPLAGMSEVEFPMFLENTALYNFVIGNMDRLALDRAGTYFVTHWNLTDAVADMWKLSPELQKAFPSTDHWFNGVNIGEGWFDLLDKVQIILRRAE